MYVSRVAFSGAMKRLMRSGGGIQEDVAHALLYLSLGQPGVLHADACGLERPRGLAKLVSDRELLLRAQAPQGFHLLIRHEVNWRLHPGVGKCPT